MSFHKKILTAMTVIFFAAMLVLSLTAETAHNASLPHVTLTKLPTYLFPFEYEGAYGETMTGSAEKTAVTAKMLEQGIFTVRSAEKNGTKRYYARKADIETGDEMDGYFEVVSGIFSADRIIENPGAELYDGAEVIVR